MKFDSIKKLPRKMRRADYDMNNFSKLNFPSINLMKNARRIKSIEKSLIS